MNVDANNFMTMLSLAFGVWAWVVAWGVSVIRKEVHEMKQMGHQTGATLVNHVNQTERRLTMLETEFTYIKTLLRNNKHGED